MEIDATYIKASIISELEVIEKEADLEKEIKELI